MKKLLILSVLSLAISFGAKAQCANPTGTGYQRPVIGFIQTYPSTDSSCWYWTRTETASFISDSLHGNFARTPTRLVSIYTHSVTPLNVISAPAYSVCITADTGFYIKVVGTDSAGWFKAR